MDADNQDEPKNLIKMSNLITKNYDLIITERKIRKHSLYMIILTFFYNKLISLLFKNKLKNYSSSLVCYKRKFVSFKNLKNNDHRYLPLIAIDNNAKKIISFPILHKQRIFGKTKYGMFKKIFFALPEFLYFYYRLKKGNFKN